MIVEPSPIKHKEAYIPEIVSEEDKQVNNEIEIFMEKIRIANDDEKLAGIFDLQKLLKDSTSSMTSVPKPLKFMVQHLFELDGFYCGLDSSSVIKKPLSDLLSVISMLDNTNNFEKLLHYCLSGTLANITSWGHEYVRHICLAMTKNQEAIYTVNLEPDLLRGVFDEIGPFLLSHNAETELCDILSEMSYLDLLVKYVDESNYQRICLYLESLAIYMEKVEGENTVEFLIQIYLKFNDYIPVIKLSVRYKLINEIKYCFQHARDWSLKIQMAFFLSLLGFNDCSILERHGNDKLIEIIGKCNYSQFFIRMARDLDAMQLKSPEDVFKCSVTISRSKGLLASVIVNAFVHAGFTKDYGFETEGDSWVNNNKSNGLVCAVASIGLVNMWNFDNGIALITKFVSQPDEFKQAGAFLAIGIINCGQTLDYEPSLAMLSEATRNRSYTCRYAAIMGLGIAYCATNNAAVIEVLMESLTSDQITSPLVGYACYSIGLIAVGSQNFSLMEKLIIIIKNVPEDQWENEFSLIYAFLGVGFIQYGITRNREQNSILNLLKSNFEGAVGNLFASIMEIFVVDDNDLIVTLETLLSTIGSNMDSYVDSAIIGKKQDKEGWADDLILYKNGFDVIALAVKCCHDEIAIQMLTRILDHIFRFGEAGEKRAVPLALAILYVSNPSVAIIETLAKYSHVSDSSAAMSCIIAMGIIGAGTNNARLASQLRHLSFYYTSTKYNNQMLTLRFAQSLLYLGKGTLSLSPFVCGKHIMKRGALMSLIGFVSSFLDTNKAILTSSSHHMYMVVPAISSRMLVTYGEDMEPLSVLVRVGQSVDLAGQTGNPRSITGFQTLSTPVLLAHGQKAELATDEYTALTPCLEGIVILKRNPDYIPS